MFLMKSLRYEKKLAIPALFAAVCVSLPGCGDPSLARMFLRSCSASRSARRYFDATW